jgi:4-diphosphocytidyl-2-C-methyl-D-erythritol kinase
MLSWPVDDLASLFQAISLSDRMSFTKLPTTAKKDEMTCSDTTLKVDSSNLVIKSLELMRQKTGRKQYFRVHLEKIVPMQAGLGGGSGNAATTMHAFNALCGYPASLEDLKLWSGAIGSDITFFFSTGTAYCTGRGEIIQSLPPLPQSDDAVVHIFKPT